jgi:hypothetical protein
MARLGRYEYTLDAESAGLAYDPVRAVVDARGDVIGATEVDERGDRVDVVCDWRLAEIQRAVNDYHDRSAELAYEAERDERAWRYL